MQHASRLAAAGLAVALALTGCQSGDDGATSDEVAGEITYAIWDVNQKPAMQRIIKEFEQQHPEVSVKLQLTPWKDYWTKLKTQTSSKTLPDVFWMNGPNFQTYAAGKQLAPITDLVDAGDIDPANYPDDLNAMYSWEDEQYGVPKDYDTVAIWYNKAIFKKAGVAEPSDDWTWDDYRETAATISKKLKGEGIWGSAEVFSNTASYYHSIAQAGGHVINADGTKSGYADPKTQEGVQFWRDLIESGATPDLDFLAENPGYSLFENGKAAMQWNGSWRVAAMAEAPVKDDVAVAPLPKGRERATVIHGLGNVMSAHSKRPAAAKAFLTFLAGKDAALANAETGAANPAYAGTQDAWVKSQPGFNLQVFIDAAEQYSRPFPISKRTENWTKYESEYLAKAFRGEMSVEDACNELAKVMDEELAKEQS